MDVSADTSVPMSWWLYFAQEEGARAAERELAGSGFLALAEHRPDIPHRAEKWLMRAARPFAMGGFAAERALLVDVARRHGGVFEGHDTGWIWDLEAAACVFRETGLKT